MAPPWFCLIADLVLDLGDARIRAGADPGRRGCDATGGLFIELGDCFTFEALPGLFPEVSDPIFTTRTPLSRVLSNCLPSGKTLLITVSIPALFELLLILFFSLE